LEILTRDVREATRRRFETELIGPVRLLFFAQEPRRLLLPGGPTGTECFFYRETRRLLEEVAAQSDLITLTEYDFQSDKEKAAEFGVEKVPAIAVLDEKDPGIRFYGIPSGYEYKSLIEAIIDVSRGTTALTQTTKEALKTINHPLHLQIFVTPTCAFCSSAVRLGHQFALESSFITADMVESTEFPHIADRYKVRGVPKIVVNDVFSFEGAVSEAVFLENIRKTLPDRDYSKV
jgi:glutaredoxin-like protein